MPSTEPTSHYTLGVVLASAVLCIAAPHSGWAQDSLPIRPDTIRGMIRTVAGAPVPDTKVVATMAPDRLQRTALTDSAGRYLLVFPQGTGDYFVSVSRIGWRPQRKRLTRVGVQRLPPWDLALGEIVTTLDRVTVSGHRERPPVGAYAPPIGASVGTVSGINASLTPEELGNPDAVLAATPGSVQTPEGVSVLGLTPDQNNTLLNGLAYSGSVPRDARTLIRVFTTAFDPARGGFSGAQTTIDLAPGGIYSSRRARITLDDPALQWGGGAENGLGNTYRQSILSAGADGAFGKERFTYNAAGQFSHRLDNAPTLFGASPEALDALSVGSAAVADLGAAASAVGIPLSAERMRGAQDRVSAIARIDHTPTGARSWAGVVSGEYTRADAGISPLGAASHTNREAGASVAAQASYVHPLPSDGANEIKTGVFLTQRRVRPTSLLPEARVLLGAADSSLAEVAIGGSGTADTRATTATWQTYDEAQWYLTNRQIAKVYIESRLETNSRHTIAPSSGLFVYDSLSALRANRPAFFARSLEAPQSEVRQWSGVVALSDQWRPTHALQIQFGARTELSKFLNVPEPNDALEQALGIRTDYMPGGVHISPRVGFNWAYGAAGGRSATTLSRLGTLVLAPAGALHGGIGEFRSTAPAGAVLASYAQTGLTSATGTLFCTGTSVPSPDWAGYEQGEATPSSCLDGDRSGTLPGTLAGALGTSAPNVVAWDPSYQPPRAWRANLGWSSYFKLLNVTVDGTVTRNLNQRSNLDANFRNVPQFVLPDEQNRPIYAAINEIDTLAERIAPGAARRTDAFSTVIVRRSDARSSARQLIVGVTPKLNFGRYFASVAYVLTDVQVVDRGFDESTFGDPSTLQAHRSLLPGSQQWHVYGGLNTRWFALTLASRFYEGERFTPLVDRDINGDGFANDRAYVPALTGSTPVDRSAFNALLDKVPGYARKCLLAQGGSVAAPGSCRAPWRAVTNAQIAFPALPGSALRRARVQLNIANPAGLLDLVLHGGNGLRGWGSTNTVDPILLRVRSFDPATRSFGYDVNPTFGRPQRSQIATRMPFRVSLGVSIDLGVPFEVQQVTRILHPTGSLTGSRPAAGRIKAEFAGNVPNLYTMILRQSDSLLLSAPQVRALQAADEQYRQRVDSVWTQLAEQITALPEPYDDAKAYAIVDRAVGKAWEITQGESSRIRGILSPIQLRLAPRNVQYVVTATEPVRLPFMVASPLP